MESQKGAIGVVSCTYSMNHLVYMFPLPQGGHQSADPATELGFATDREQWEYLFCLRHWMDGEVGEVRAHVVGAAVPAVGISRPRYRAGLESGQQMRLA